MLMPIFGSPAESWVLDFLAPTAPHCKHYQRLVGLAGINPGLHPFVPPHLVMSRNHTGKDGRSSLLKYLWAWDRGFRGQCLPAVRLISHLHIIREGWSQWVRKLSMFTASRHSLGMFLMCTEDTGSNPGIPPASVFQVFLHILPSSSSHWDVADTCSRAQ